MSCTVVGVDGAPLPPGALAALADAEVVAGAARHLAAVASTLPGAAERIELGPVEPALAKLAGRRSVVLASGDPGFFGIVRLLREHGVQPTVLPALSAVQTAFARLGRPWDDVAVVSAHGRDLRPAVNVCRARAATAVLTAPGAGPAEIAAELAGWPRTLVVAEDLGGPGERLVTLDATTAAHQDWNEPNLLLCLRGRTTGAGGGPAGVAPRGWFAGGEPTPPLGGWALPESEFEHRDGMVTKAEIRAYALARLAPRPGTLVWDVGAGSGSIAIECARLGAAALAVERDADSADRIVTNAANHAVEVRIVAGHAPGALANLPQPDAVWVGGGGLDVVDACVGVGASRVVLGLAALDRVAPARAALRAAGYAVEGVQLAASRLAELPDGSVRLAATNPVTLLCGQR